MKNCRELDATPISSCGTEFWINVDIRGITIPSPRPATPSSTPIAHAGDASSRASIAAVVMSTTVAPIETSVR